MSLRDELVQVLGNDLADAALPIVERALAAERAATIQECKKLAAKFCSGNNKSDWPHQSWCGCEVAEEIGRLPQDRSPLDAPVAQARAEAKDEVLVALGDGIEELLPGVGLKWDIANDHDSAVEWLRRVVAQAREKDARDLGAMAEMLVEAKAQARHEMNQRIAEHLHQPADAMSTIQMLDSALIQARAEQEERSFLLGVEFGFKCAEKGNNLEAALSEAAAIREEK